MIRGDEQDMTTECNVGTQGTLVEKLMKTK